MFTKHELTNEQVLEYQGKHDELEQTIEKDRKKIEKHEREIAFLRDKIQNAERILNVLNTVKYLCEEMDGTIAISSLGINTDKCETLKATDCSMTRYGMIFKSNASDKWTGKLGDSSNRTLDLPLGDSYEDREAVEVAILDWIIEGTVPEGVRKESIER